MIRPLHGNDKTNHTKSFVHGQPPAQRKCLRICRINFDYRQQKKVQIRFSPSGEDWGDPPIS